MYPIHPRKISNQKETTYQDQYYPPYSLKLSFYPNQDTNNYQQCRKCENPIRKKDKVHLSQQEAEAYNHDDYSDKDIIVAGTVWIVLAHDACVFLFKLTQEKGAGTGYLGEYRGFSR
jgi:hypothetical protein